MLFLHNASGLIMGLLLVLNGLLYWFRNCPGYLLAPLNGLHFLVDDGLFVIKGYPRHCCVLVTAMCSRRSHQVVMLNPNHEVSLEIERVGLCFINKIK